MTTDSKPLLVIEDDEGLQSQLRWAFDGYEVICAGDRKAGINALRRHQPGVVLLDLGLFDQRCIMPHNQQLPMHESCKLTLKRTAGFVQPLLQTF